MSFRIPLSTKYVQMAAAGRATGTWHTRENKFVFCLPPDIPQGLFSRNY